MNDFEETKRTVARELIRIFSDVSYFGKLAPRIIRLLEDVPSYAFINRRTMAIAMNRYFDLSELTRKSPSAIALKKQIEIVVCCAYIMMKIHDPNVQGRLWTDIERLHDYGFQINVETEEQIYLLNFRNYMVIALMLLPPEENKKLLLDICSRLEGRDEFIERHTGGGQTNDVRRRMQIYYLENNLPVPESAVILRDQQSHRKTKSTSSVPQPTPEELMTIDYEPKPILTDYQLQHIRDHMDHPYVPVYNVSGEMSEDQLQAVTDMVNVMHRMFSDFLHFELLMTRPLKQHFSEMIKIHAECNDELQLDAEEYVKMIKVNREREVLSEFHSFKIFDSSDLRQLWKIMEVIMRTATVYFLSQEPAIQERYFITDPTILTARYTSFTAEQGVNETELTYLVAFRNAVKLELVLDHKKEKVMALQVGERLEGGYRSYVLGSKASAATRRRIEIYEQEGGNAPRKRAAHSFGGDSDYDLLHQQQDRTPRFEALRNMQQQHDEMIDVANALMSIRAPEKVKGKGRKKHKRDSDSKDDEIDDEDEQQSDTNQVSGGHVFLIPDADALLPEAPSVLDRDDSAVTNTHTAMSINNQQAIPPVVRKRLTSENMLAGKRITRNESDGSTTNKRRKVTPSATAALVARDSSDEEGGDLGINTEGGFRVEGARSAEMEMCL